MQLDGLWTVHALLALSSFALGTSVSSELVAAPRVFVSFKGKTQASLFCLPLVSQSLLICWFSDTLPRVCSLCVLVM